jgi:hypothetical protein
MFRNVIRNISRSFELTLNEKVMRHAMSVGYHAKGGLLSGGQ